MFTFLVFRRPFAIFRIPYEKSTRKEERQEKEEARKIAIVSFHDHKVLTPQKWSCEITHLVFDQEEFYD